ncbi:AraC family transcriptional regulator [Pusillimonas sp. T2]|uniref:helix-turn-helix domain-containing protein n=1 Tax=Pusillimonas sp. T2 TaxID=1548123 RepID=UPI000B9C9A94|nr:helix-turn-helix domain-containing protein [Pusillimonas sp. T2]OXR49527.1 AraC family transcriptional regulator [Pusillimonas sp. T2]
MTQNIPVSSQSVAQTPTATLTLPPASTPLATSRVPVYKLYGESDQWLMPDMVHCELIADRSRLHDWEIKLHQHHGLVQLLYLKGGTARVGLDDHVHDMQPGHVVLVPQMCVHGFRFAPNAQGHVVTMAHPLVDTLLSTLGAVDSGLLVPEIYPLDVEVDASVDQAFSLLDREYRGAALHRERLMESLLQGIFIWISRQTANNRVGQARPEDRGREYFRQFGALIERHYAEGWSVEQYAQAIGITAAYLNLLCRQWVGQSALALVHQRIILAAKRDLVYTTMTVSVVSYALGFTDPAYFTRFFKRHVGVSPKAFRQQATSMLELAGR